MGKEPDQDARYHQYRDFVDGGKHTGAVPSKPHPFNEQQAAQVYTELERLLGPDWNNKPVTEPELPIVADPNISKNLTSSKPVATETQLVQKKLPGFD